MTATCTAEQTVTTLTAEGNPEADILAAIDSLIESGLELDQPENGRIFSAGEVDVLRDQLKGSRRISVSSNCPTYVMQAARERALGVRMPGWGMCDTEYFRPLKSGEENSRVWTEMWECDARRVTEDIRGQGYDVLAIEAPDGAEVFPA